MATTEVIMKKIAFFPGTFDPVTVGHLDIIQRALELFDEVVIGIGVNTAKQPLFSEEQRHKWLVDLFQNQPRIRVTIYDGLTVDCCRKEGARFILRGVRNGTDLEYEKAIADVNRIAAKNIETIFLTCRPEYSTISSTLVRDMIRHKRDISEYLPEVVIKDLSL